jgi:hypothetical protein
MTALLHSIYSWLHNHESLALWLEGIALVLILAWDVWSHIQQRQETVDQMKIMERQALGMETAANAAKKSAELAEMSLRLAERADVLLEAVGPVHHPNSGGILTGYSNVIFRFKNFGRTRGTNVRYEASLSVDGNHNPLTEAEPAVLGPGETQSLRFGQFRDWLNEETFKAIVEGRASLTFKSKVTYDDTFGESHVSENSGTYVPDDRVFRQTFTRAT